MNQKLSVKSILIILFVITPNLVLAQIPYHSKDKKAINYYEDAYRQFNSREDDLAFENLKKALDRDNQFFEAWELLSRVQYENGDIDGAIESLYMTIKIDPTIHPENYYFLASFEKDRGEYAKANDLFEIYLKSGDKNDIKIQKSLSAIYDCKFAIDAIANPVPFVPKNLGKNINTSDPEYLPCLTADDGLMLFTRRTADNRAPEGVQDDLFYALKNDNSWQPAKRLSGINTVYNEGAASISADGSTLVFTACDLYGKYGEGRSGYGSCDLFISYRISTGWSEPMNLGDSINSANWESQPSLSADGRTIYFIRAPRKRRADQNQDIFVAVRQPNNYWTKAKKLPENINSPLREETVLIHPDGVTLYFSSNGHPGMGGLDLFMTQKDELGNWSKPENLGFPINTLNDENSLMVSTNGELAYFSSNMEGGFGSFDIYAFELHTKARPLPVTYVKGMVYDSLTHKPIEARFELIDLDTGEEVYNSFSNPEDGEFLIPLPAGKMYALNVNHKGYLFYSDHFALEEDDQLPFMLNIPLLPISKGGEVILKNVFFDTDKYDLQPQSQSELNKLVRLMEQNPSLNILIEGHTDNVGNENHNMVLSENRAKAVYSFLISRGISDNRLAYNGFGETRPVAENSTDIGRASNRRTSFIVTSH